jgi:HD-GYP domain-containing protein (c-di-GMP phosphodiesterase class II)
MFIVDDGEYPDHLIGHESYAHDYIQKPISVSEFKIRIQSLMNLVETDEPTISEVERPSTPSNEPSKEEGRTQILELTERIKNLLEELSSCLGELEELIKTEEIEEGDAAAEPEALESESPAENLIFEVDAPDEKIQVADNRLEPEGTVSTQEEVSDGVEDIFSEFFAMELASRTAAQAVSIPPEEELTPEIPEEESEEVEACEEQFTSRQDPSEDSLYEQAVSYVLGSIRNAVSGEPPDIFCGAKLAESIVGSVGESLDLIRTATNREQDYAVSRHSVNVAIIAARVAQFLGLGLQKQREVCLAGLLHELGVAKLPAELIHHEGSLTSEDLKLIRRRPIQSGKIISELGPEYVWLAEIVGQVAERENGTGSPAGLVGDEIDERAKIIGIADVFDAYIHRRPYRECVSGYQALFELTTDQQRAFSDHMVKALIRSFSLYPYNECVRLSTGEVGKVIDINPGNLSRPVVSILFDKDGTPLTDERIVDLGRESTLYIAEALAGRSCSSYHLS